jgi:ABC-type dipeptide/oligopeptide/nickel transport system permease component
MCQYVIKRLLLALPTLFCITLIVFLLTRIIPGDVVELMFEEQGYAEELEAMRALLGLDRPLHVQYLAWLGQVVRGDLGRSLWTNHAVSDEILYRLPVTLELGGLAMLFTVITAVPLGVMAAVRQDTLRDYVARSVAIGGLSIPNFRLATMVIVLPAYYVAWTPPIQYVRFADNPSLKSRPLSFFKPADPRVSHQQISESPSSPIQITPLGARSRLALPRPCVYNSTLPRVAYRACGGKSAIRLVMIDRVQRCSEGSGIEE